MNNDQLILGVLTQRLGSADWSKWQIQRASYYDYIRYASTGQMSFFANALGSTDPNSTLAKTKEETNLSKPRTFGQQYFIIRQIRTHINVLPKARQASAVSAHTDYTYLQTPISQFVYALMDLGVLRISIGQKDYFDIEQPFKFCPPGMGLGRVNVQSAQVSTPLGAYGNSYVRQSGDIRDVYALTPPQLVEPEQTFDSTIDFPYANSPAIPQVASTNVNINIGLIFDGYVARPAQ